MCVDLREAQAQVGITDLPWPEVDGWMAAVRASPLLGRPRCCDCSVTLLYLDRYWLEEEQVCADLLALSASRAADELPGYERLFPPGYEEQRIAADIVLAQAVTVLTGGPGTGKTTHRRATAGAAGRARRARRRAPPRIALAAPTGKAAARLTEAVAAEVEKLDAVDANRLAGVRATTLHRLLGPRPDTSVRFKHNRGNRLPHDVIVVDETSMVSLTMMARLLEAVRPNTRLILVGDPDQLASVEAGAVLADLVEGLTGRDDVRVAALHTRHRFGESIGALAEAIRIGDAEGAVTVLRAGGEHVEWIDDRAPGRAAARGAGAARAAGARGRGAG